MPLTQVSVFEAERFGAVVGVLSGTALRTRTVRGYTTEGTAADAGVRAVRSLATADDGSIVLYDPQAYASDDALGAIERRTGWSGAPFSSVVDQIAAIRSGDWTPPFPFQYGEEPPTPPFEIYTDGTYTPPSEQDDGRTPAGVGFVVVGANDVLFGCGLPAPHITDSISSEYYAILSALSTTGQRTGATVYTDHRNVPDVASGVAPDRCADITDPLSEIFDSTAKLSIEATGRSDTRLADGLATAGTRNAVALGTPPRR